MANERANEFWHDMQTEKSWKILQDIKGKFHFVLIGGWAVYLWTQSQKSKDIDIIVDVKTLAELKRQYDLRKNDIMRKYEIKIDEIDIDIYVKHYSKLLMEGETAKIEGFTVAKPEWLLALKQTAEISRSESEKGAKDRIDIMGMLLKCDIDFKKYASLTDKQTFARLLAIARAFNEPHYFGMNPRQMKVAKTDLIRKIEEARV